GAVRLRVLRAVRAGVSHRRHHHDEVVRSGHERPPRDAAGQGPAACDRARLGAVVGHRQQAPRHAGPAQARPRRGQGAHGRARGESEGERRVTAETVGFWAVAVVLLASSLATVLTPNLFHAVLFLAVALVATGGVFLLLDAPFLFGVQLLLYAGGVVTVMVFAIMLTERIVGERISQASRYIVDGALEIGSAAWRGRGDV